MDASTDGLTSSSDDDDRETTRRVSSVVISGAGVVTGAANVQRAPTPREETADAQWQRQAALLLERHLDTVLLSVDIAQLAPAENLCDDTLRVFSSVRCATKVAPGGLLLAQSFRPQGLSGAAARRAAKPRKRASSDSEDEPKRLRRVAESTVDGESLLAAAQAHALRGLERVQAAVAVVDGDTPEQRRKARRKEKRRLAIPHSEAPTLEGALSVPAQPVGSPAKPVESGACDCRQESTTPATGKLVLSQRERKRRNREAALAGQ